MGIRKAAATAILGTALAMGTLAVPAQAAPVKAGPVTIAAQWVTVGTYHFRAECETAALPYALRGTRVRCLFSGVFSGYSLQILM